MLAVEYVKETDPDDILYCNSLRGNSERARGAGGSSSSAHDERRKLMVFLFHDFVAGSVGRQQPTCFGSPFTQDEFIFNTPLQG